MPRLLAEDPTGRQDTNDCRKRSPPQRQDDNVITTSPQSNSISKRQRTNPILSLFRPLTSAEDSQKTVENPPKAKRSENGVRAGDRDSLETNSTEIRAAQCQKIGARKKFSDGIEPTKPPNYEI